MDGVFQQTIPFFIKAKTEMLLVEAMMENNRANNRHFKYFDISFNGKDYTAWYYVSQGELAKALYAGKKDATEKIGDAKANTKRFNKKGK